METLKSTRFKLTLEEEKLINDYCDTQKRSFAFVVQLAVSEFAERLKEEIKAKAIPKQEVKAKATPPSKQEIKAKLATTPKKKKRTVKPKVATPSQQTILPTKNEAQEVKE